MLQGRWTIQLSGESVPDKALIGGKAWSIARMRASGLPVPPAFVITTEACRAYLETSQLPPGLEQEIDAGIAHLENQTGRRFGAETKPLLISVRSGAAISMPGMMDTVLNLGMTPATEAALARESGQAEFARDTHRRFLELFSTVILKRPPSEGGAAAAPADLRVQMESAGFAVPGEVREQLLSAVRAVFASWNGRRARRYREHNDIPHNLGTAVTVQAMVFGNLDERSGTGVLFSRNPLTGAPAPFGEYLPRSQGEDVVSGRFTPQPLEEMAKREPKAHAALLAAAKLLEQQQRDIQDIEFTVQGGELYLLQTRSAKRAPQAAVRAAVDMVQEGLIDIDTALSRVSAEQVSTLLLPRLAPGASDTARVLASGEGACPGVGSGTFVCDPGEAERRSSAGEDVILVRKTTSPEDIHGMIAARAIVTEQGGSTSHAAVVSRALGRPCVVGVGDLSNLSSGELGTVEGAAGKVYAGALTVARPDEAHDPLLVLLIQWARERIAITVLRPEEAPPSLDCVDLDNELTAPDADGLTDMLTGRKAAKGVILSNPVFARRAAALGVKKLITKPVLPALLAIREDAK